MSFSEKEIRALIRSEVMNMLLASDSKKEPDIEYLWQFINRRCAEQSSSGNQAAAQVWFDGRTVFSSHLGNVVSMRGISADRHGAHRAKLVN